LEAGDAFVQGGQGAAKAALLGGLKDQVSGFEGEREGFCGGPHVTFVQPC